MPLDPQLAAILAMTNNAPPLSAGTITSARTGFRFMTVDLRDPATKDAVRSVQDTTYPAAEGDRAARVYRPDVDGPVPTAEAKLGLGEEKRQRQGCSTTV